MYREGPKGTPFHSLLFEGYIEAPIDSYAMLMNGGFIYLENTPSTKEAYYLRVILSKGGVMCLFFELDVNGRSLTILIAQLQFWMLFKCNFGLWILACFLLLFLAFDKEHEDV